VLDLNVNAYVTSSKDLRIFTDFPRSSCWHLKIPQGATNSIFKAAWEKQGVFSKAL
jgi:2-C-methyl-D-erythritol 4-phosphate cytidylyltransferase